MSLATLMLILVKEVEKITFEKERNKTKPFPTLIRASKLFSRLQYVSPWLMFL